MIVKFFIRQQHSLSEPVGTFETFLLDLTQSFSQKFSEYDIEQEYNSLNAEQFNFYFSKTEKNYMNREAAVVLRLCNDKIDVYDISIKSTGNGLGTKILKSICDVADKNNFPMSYKSIPYNSGDPEVVRQRHTHWLERNGFIDVSWDSPRKHTFLQKIMKSLGLLK